MSVGAYENDYLDELRWFVQKKKIVFLCTPRKN